MRKQWVGVVVVVCLGLSLAAWAQESGRSDARPAAPGRVAGDEPRRVEPGVAPRMFASPPRRALLAEPAPVLPAKEGPQGHTRLVVRLAHAPAGDVAAAINEFLRTEGRSTRVAAAPSVAIVPDVVSNSLLLGGPADAIREVTRLVEQLDRPATMVALDLVLAEAPIAAGDAKQGPGAGLRRVPKPDQCEPFARIHLVTLDNQKAMVQVGRREAVVQGTSVSKFGTTNSVSYNQVGTIVNVTPRVGPDNQVTLDLQVEDSHAGRPEEGTPISISKEGETIRAPNIETLSAKTTISVRAGETTVLGGHSYRRTPGRQTLLLVTPQVLRLDGAPAPARPAGQGKAKS